MRTEAEHLSTSRTIDPRINRDVLCPFTNALLPGAFPIPPSRLLLELFFFSELLLFSPAWKKTNVLPAAEIKETGCSSVLMWFLPQASETAAPAPAAEIRSPSHPLLQRRWGLLLLPWLFVKVRVQNSSFSWLKMKHRLNRELHTWNCTCQIEIDPCRSDFSGHGSSSWMNWIWPCLWLVLLVAGGSSLDKRTIGCLSDSIFSLLLHRKSLK